MSRWRIALIASSATVLLGASSRASAQITASLEGRVFDTSGGRIAGAVVRVRSDPTGFDVAVRTDADGHYDVAAIPPAVYTVSAEAAGFGADVVESLPIDGGGTLVYDFRLAVANRRETVLVRAGTPLVERATAASNHVVTAATIRQAPLNGRHFTDLGLLGPESVAPSQTGYSSRPIRGVGVLALNIGGNREEAVGFVVNGVTTNNLTFGSLIFEPPLASIEEVRVERSTYGAEYGHVSGAVVNIVTRSGSDEFRGELFEFVRNDAFDARNFFEVNAENPHRFQRNQFGGSAGGPVIRGRTFFFTTYEGLRQRQGVDVNSLVLTDDERAAATDPAVRRLIELIPQANVIASDGSGRFVGAAAAIADMDRWTVDLRHNAGARAQVHGYYGAQHVRSVEPLSQGNSIPGFGHVSRPLRSALTLEETHVFGPTLLNELRFGRVRLVGGTFPATPLNPADFGIGNGVTRAIGLPQMAVAGGLNFGGPGILPQGRYDTSYVVTDTLSRVAGGHSLKLGGEYRHFVNENFAEGTGAFNFPSIPAFLSGTANAFSITLGERESVIDQRAIGVFAQDRVTRGSVTLDVGLRYEWHMTPAERLNCFVVFDAPTSSLLRVGLDGGDIYRQNSRNIEPRLGLAWDLSSDGRIVLRAAYGRTVDEPGTTAVRDTAGNPPFASPLAASGSVLLSNAIATTRPVGLAPASIDPAFRNASLQSWNVSLQRQLGGTLAAAFGYSGSRGADLRLSRNLNQPVDGVRPFPVLSALSAILPGATLGNITQVESTGFSSYHAGWVSLTRRLSRGLQFDTSYTLSKSRDTNSLNSNGFAIQNGYDLAGEWGLSDFDARHRVVVTATYALPFADNIFAREWQVAAIVQAQSGNPVNIVTSNSMLNGLPNTVRPDLVGPIRTVGSVDQWFDTSAFVAVNRFGNLRRNAVTGPGLVNTDVSVSRNFRTRERVAIQVRVDAFDVFNHPNFGPPGNIVGTPNFGRITRTRLPTGEAGSSRQIQFAGSLSF